MGWSERFESWEVCQEVSKWEVMRTKAAAGRERMFRKRSGQDSLTDQECEGKRRRLGFLFCVRFRLSPEGL